MGTRTAVRLPKRTDGRAAVRPSVTVAAMTYVPARIAEIASELGRLSEEMNTLLSERARLAPHPETVAALGKRGGREQINPSVPRSLKLWDRLTLCARDRQATAGDITAEAVDTWLRLNGYPPRQ